MQKKMPKLSQSLWLAGLLAIALGAPAWGQSKQSQNVSIPKVGDAAPSFKLNYFDGNDLKEVSLSQYRGKKNVVVAFYIFAFTGG